MLRDVQYGLSIPQRLSYERELVVLQVTQAAVEQTRRPLRRPAGDIALVQEQNPQAPHRSVTGYAGAVYAGSDYDEIEGLPLDGSCPFERHPRHPLARLGEP